jgi:tRNA1(Val) A37 N6-methylase TrmN6
MYLVEAEEIYRESLGENVRVFGQGHQGRIKIVMADWRHLGPRELGGPLDYAIVNPPYFPLGSSGPIKAGRQRGRHETRGDLGDLFKAAQRLLKAGRPLALCWPRARLGALIGAAAENGFALVKLRLPPRPGSALVLAEFRS